MIFPVKAIFDGKVFIPLEPVKLAAGSKVEIAVSTGRPVKMGKPYSLLRKIAAMKLKGPSDWSENFEQYLNGKPLRFGKVLPAPANLKVKTSYRAKAKGVKK